VEVGWEEVNRLGGDREELQQLIVCRAKTLFGRVAPVQGEQIQSKQIVTDNVFTMQRRERWDDGGGGGKPDDMHLPRNYSPPMDALLCRHGKAR
jgi:hypothetical protein